MASDALRRGTSKMRSSHRHGIWKREGGEIDSEFIEGTGSGIGPLLLR